MVLKEGTRVKTLSPEEYFSMDFIESGRDVPTYNGKYIPENKCSRKGTITTTHYYKSQESFFGDYIKFREPDGHLISTWGRFLVIVNTVINLE